MQVVLSEMMPLLCSDGNWASARELIGDQNLVSFVDGGFTPVKAHITSVDDTAIYEFRTGTLRRVLAGHPLEFMNENGWCSTRGMYQSSRFSTHHILKYNRIHIPRLIDVFGDNHTAPDWNEMVIKSILEHSEYGIYLPSYLVYLDKHSLCEILYGVFKSLYPDLRIYPGAMDPKMSRSIRLRGINQKSHDILVHLMGRLGIQLTARAGELKIRDVASRDRFAALLRLYRPKNLNDDIPITDYIRVFKQHGNGPAVTIETDAPNICDGGLVWRVPL